MIEQMNLTPQMFDEAKRMAASAERKRIIRLLNETLPKHRLAVVNGEVGIIDGVQFITLEKVIRNGNGNSDSAPAEH